MSFCGLCVCSWGHSTTEHCNTKYIFQVWSLWQVLQNWLPVQPENGQCILKFVNILCAVSLAVLDQARDESCIGSKWGGLVGEHVWFSPPPAAPRHWPQVCCLWGCHHGDRPVRLPNRSEFYLVLSKAGLLLTPLLPQLVLVDSHLLRVLFVWLLILNSLPSTSPIHYCSNILI